MSSHLQQSKMNGNNIPKRKKNIDTSAIKRSQSEDILNKTTKRKPSGKKLAQPLIVKPTLTRSTDKLGKVTKSKKEKKPKLVKKSLKSEKQNLLNAVSSAKTLKKFLKKKKQKQEELTERKKIHLEYFMYRDVYVPIQNTEQRKIIYKIQLIDQKVQKQPKICEPFRKQDVPKVDMAIQKTDRRTDFQCQTQSQNKNGKVQVQQFSQESQKCFAQTLSQIEFLYLPDQKNFENFTRQEKAHYKQLLLYMAKKFEEPAENILDEQTVEMMLQERYLSQRGVNNAPLKKGIPTHTPSIISYITNLFCYLEISEKGNFIDRINCSYGYSMAERLTRVRASKSTKLHSQLISESTFWKFQAELHQGYQFESDTIQKALHSHNRAVFDTVNQALLQFQPYYSSQGQPFPWSHNFETTFYCISQNSFGALVCQIKDKIWQLSTTLGGILLDSGGNRTYKAHYNKILAIQQQFIHNETKKYNDKIEVDQTRTRVLFEVADYVEQAIIKQMALLLCL